MDRVNPVNLSRRAGQSRSGGFSLVEVVLAIGVLAFAVVPLIGTIAVALDSSRFSQEDAEMALFIRSVRSRLQTEAGAGLSRYDSLVDELRQPGGRTIYLAADGRILESNGEEPDGAHYRCRVEIAPGGFSTDTPDRAIATLTLTFPSPIYAKERKSLVPLFRYGTIW